MNNAPLVSVIMPTYNDKESFLRESIESILNQTYHNIELIIADDSTSLSTKTIIDEYADKDSRVRVVRSAERMGVCKALNRAIADSRGDYIAHMDADDVSLPDRIRVQITAFESDEEIAVVGGQTIIIDEKGNRIGVPSHIPCTSDDIYSGFKRGKALISNPTSMVKKVIFDKIGGYDEFYGCSEDFDLWYRISTLGVRFYNVSEVVLYYRVHGENAHIKLADLQSKLCCITLVKYAVGHSGRLAESQFESLERYVERNIVGRGVRAVMRPDTLLSRAAVKLRVNDWLLSSAIRYFKMRGRSIKQLMFL